MNKDTIYRQDALDALGDKPETWNDTDYELGQVAQWHYDRTAIAKLPSAQPEIIRCKDCKWYGRADKRRFYRGMDCLQKRIDTIIPDKDFCSYAERKKENG